MIIFDLKATAVSW